MSYISLLQEPRQDLGGAADEMGGVLWYSWSETFLSCGLTNSPAAQWIRHAKIESRCMLSLPFFSGLLSH